MLKAHYLLAGAATLAAVLGLGMREAKSAPVPIAIQRTVTITSDAMGDPHAESFLAIDPKDDNTMLVTSSAIEHGGLRDVLYLTRDGGTTWRRVHFSDDDPIVIFDGGDPTVYFAPDGRGYFIVMGHSGFTLTATDDRGATWTRGVHTNVMEGYDRNYFAFDASGRYQGRMYSWGDVTIHDRDKTAGTGLGIVSSSDRGATFGPTQVIAASLSDPVPELSPVDLVVTPDGTLFMPVEGENVYSEKPTAVETGKLFSVASTDGGKTFSKAKPIIGFNTRVGEVNSVEGWGGIPRAAIDLSSSPYRGRIYLLYVNAKRGGNDLFVVHSSDRWQTWSAPAKVNDDTTSNGHANPAIAVNSKGAVAVIWNDRRANPKSLCYQLYLSASVDGGMHFGRNVRVPGKATCPTAPGNFKPAAISQDFPHGVKLIDLLMVPTRWSNGGDTQGLVATTDGVFHAGWIDGSSGIMQIAQTDFSVDAPITRTGLRGPGNVFPPVTPPAASVLGDQVKIEIVSRRINMIAGTIALTVRLRNSSKASITGPISLVFQKLQGNLPKFRVTNADNKLGKKGAAWRFAPGGSTLPPNATTGSREIDFAFLKLPARPAYPTIFFEVHRK